ncbi:MAG: type IV secretion system protein [Candidatus Doudnabacteria bacterium]|nr:type IV secretion system protein [Candidatus Doudnabacteria bacterium]
MFLKIKKLAQISLILVVVAGSFASSFFVYPAKQVDAATCANQVIVTKPIVSKDEFFTVYASSNSSKSKNCTGWMDEDDFFVFTFWTGNSIFSTQLFRVSIPARYHADGPGTDYATEASEKFRASDILKNLDGTNGGSFYVFVSRDWEYAPIESSYINSNGTKVTVEPGSKEHGEDFIIDGSQIGAVCSPITSGEVEFERTSSPPPIKVFYKSVLGYNIRTTLPTSLAEKCKNVQSDDDPDNDVFLNFHNSDGNGAFTGKQVTGFKANPILSNGVLTGFTGGLKFGVSQMLTPDQITKFGSDKAFTLTLHLQAYSRSGPETAESGKGVPVASPVEIVIVGDETQASAIDPSFVQEYAQAGGAPNNAPVSLNDATPIADFLAGIIGDIISFIQLLLFKIFGVVVLPLITTLISIPTYTDNFAAVILPGWELLRNLSNIFFILVLLVIGLGTLFRVQGYQYKNLLLKLIFAAFMVNFSLVLTQSFLAVAETAQFQFLPQGKEGEKVINVIANELMIAPLNQNTLTPEVASKNLSEGLSRLVFPFFYLSLTFMAFVVFVSLAFFLVLRMIVIWILLMASPIAIVATVIPQTKKYATTWLSYLVQYGFFVAILGFFLNVTAYLAQRQEGVLKALGSQGKEASFEEFLSRIATNIFVMGFLVAGLKVAGGMKVIGASTLNKFATKAGKLPFDFLKGVGKYAGERTFEGVQNVTGVTVDPRIWKKDWDSYLKRRDKEKADRLLARRTGEKGLAGKIPGIKNLKLGSPDDIFENLLTPEGLMKIAKTPKQALDNIRAKRAKDSANIMTEEEREQAIKDLNENKNTKIPALTAEIANLNNGTITASDATARALMKDALDSEHDELSSRWQKLEDAKRLLASQGKSTADVDDEIAKILGDIDNVEDNQALLANGSDLKIKDMIDGAKTDRVKGELKKLSDDIKDKVTNDRDEAQKEVDGFKGKTDADDKLREKHKFSKYDPAGKAADPNYKEFSADDKKMAHEIAEDYSGSAEKYKFSPLYKTADEEKKKQAELRKKWEESGAETADDYISIAKRAVRTNDKDVKIIMSEAFKKAALEGGAVDFMKAFAKENRGVSPQAFREFMQKDLKGLTGMDDKQILKLAFEIGKATNKAKQPNLSYMVQRTGGGFSWNGNNEQQKKVGEAYSKMSTNQFVQLDKSAMYNIEIGPGGKEKLKMSDVTKERWAVIPASEGKAVINGLSRAGAENFKNADNAPTLDPSIQRIIDDKARTP